MIAIDNLELYEACLQSLSEKYRGGYKSRIVQIFLAAKYYGTSFPTVGTGSTLPIGELQRILDGFYRKLSRDDIDGSIAMVFQGNHLPPTGVIGANQSGPSNIWRNNFGLQKATVCFASEVQLSSSEFLTQSRLNCPHLRTNEENSLRGARCGLNLGPSYRNEDGPKAFREDPVSREYSIVDPSNIVHWRPVLTLNGSRIPILPIIVALYHDSEVAGGRASIDTVSFMRDFGFSNEEYDAYFDDDMRNPINQALIEEFSDLNLAWMQNPPEQTQAELHQATIPMQPVEVVTPNNAEPLNPEGLVALPERNEAPAVSEWWSAEQAVKQYLKNSGWRIIDRSGQRVGFDIEISKAAHVRPYYIEVKSSTGNCSPTLTKNEYLAAERHGARYVLAIVENYSSTERVRIRWVPNPAGLGLTARSVEEYPIPRSKWLAGEGNLPI